MDIDVYEKPKMLIEKYETRDPFELARLLGCFVKFINTKTQKGFCKIIFNNRFIFINQNMTPQMQRMTCAHELGHILLHKEALKQQGHFAEMELFDITDHRELEANQFAANLLIDDQELLELLKDGYDMVGAAAQLNVNVNMLMVKLLSMNKTGYDFDLPYYPNARFLGTIQDE